MHGEYHRAFGTQAEVIGAGDLHLPFWLLNFQELRSVLTSPDDHHDAQVEILSDAIVVAKKRYSDAVSGRVRSRVLDTSAATVDSPTPFRLSDLITFIDEQLGKLERPYPTLAYRRLKSRIEHASPPIPVMSSCSAIPTWKTRWWTYWPACSACPITAAPSP